MRLFFIQILRSLLSYCAAGCVLFITVPLLLILVIVIPQKKRCTNSFLFSVLNLFYSAIIWSLFVPVKVSGAENIPTEAAIIVANHQSTIDIPMIGMVMERKPHIWYALSYYADMPILGFFIRRLGVSLQRESLEKAAHGLLRGIRIACASPCHVIIFPEGTRYIDGKIHDFLRGFAIIARKTGRPVIPILMPYNGKVYPPQSFIITSHPLAVEVGRAMSIRDNESDEEFVERVRDWFVEQNKNF